MSHLRLLVVAVTLQMLVREIGQEAINGSFVLGLGRNTSKSILEYKYCGLCVGCLKYRYQNAFNFYVMEYFRDTGAHKKSFLEYS